MEKDIQVLVVDDHQVVREGLRRLLEYEEDIECIGQAADAEDRLGKIFQDHGPGPGADRTFHDDRHRVPVQGHQAGG